MSIYVGQTVTVTATVTANGTALSNATVTGSYSGPASGSLTFSQSSTAGVYTSSFTVSASGSYTVSVTATESGYETGTGTATFTAYTPPQIVVKLAEVTATPTYPGQSVTVAADVSYESASGLSPTSANVTGSYSGPNGDSGSLAFSEYTAVTSSATTPPTGYVEYRASFTPQYPGTYTISVTASQTDFTTGSVNGSITVSEYQISVSVSVS